MNSDDDVVSPALKRLPGNIELLHGTVAGLELMLLKAERLADDRVQRAVPFLGLIWLYASAMRDLLRSRTADGRMLWNAPALAALCRPLQDAFLSFYYFAIETPAPDDAEFRALLITRHQTFKRWDLLRRSDPNNEAIAKELDHAQKQYEEADQRLRAHPYLTRLSAKVAANILGKPERFIADPLHEVWTRAGMPVELYDVTFRYLSQYTHATPYAVASLRYHQADQEGGAVRMSVPLTLAFSCAATALQHAGSLHKELAALLPKAFVKFMEY